MNACKLVDMGSVPACMSSRADGPVSPPASPDCPHPQWARHKDHIVGVTWLKLEAAELDSGSAYEARLRVQMAALEGMLYHDGTKISDHIPEALYTQAVEALRDSGSYMSALDLYKPVLWSSFIDNALYDEYGVDSELGIDMYFLNDAHGTGKEILEVESVQFQYDMLAGYSEELQILLLEGSVYSHQNPDEGREQVHSLLEAWSSGDAEALYALLSEEGDLETEEERELYAEYNDAMIVKRNISMADYAEEALASGKELFICVGAAHVVGAGAMADLLAQRGYTVERVTP